MKQPHKVYGINTTYMIAVELMALAENLRLKNHIEQRILTWNGVREDFLEEVQFELKYGE